MTITSRSQILQSIAKGNGSFMPFQAATPSGGTAAINTSGYFTVNLVTNALGTSFPGTFVELPNIDTASANNYDLEYLGSTAAGNSPGKQNFIGRLYKFGTLNLTATGNQFTHDSATFPVNRTIMGVSAPINLIPIIYITNATTTTVPVIVLETASSGAGYVNQNGSNVIGTKSFTFPSATTAVQSAFILRLEQGDSGVRDITQINVTTSAATGAAVLYGLEVLGPIGTPIAGVGTVWNGMSGSIVYGDSRPAAATSGTVTSYKAMVGLGSGNNWSFNGISMGVINI